MLVWWAFFSVFIIYFVLRLSFVFANSDLLPRHGVQDLLMAFLYGVRFDLFSIAALSLLPALVWWMFSLTAKRKLGDWIFLGFFALVHLPFIVVNLADVEFAKFSGRRFDYNSLFMVREMQGGVFWGTLKNYWALYVGGILLIGIFIWFLRLGLRWRSQERRLPKWKKIAGALVSVIVLFVCIRGGWQPKPLNFAHAQVFDDPKLNQVVMNSSFSFLQTMSREATPHDEFMTEKEMLSLMNGAGEEASLLEGHQLKTPQNVVVIILESFSLEMTGRPHGGQGWTPFLDELADKGLAFSWAFANGRRSIEGLASILSSLPSMMPEPFISSPFTSNHFYSLGSSLKPHGYHTSFFHGAKNGSMYFDQYARIAGLDHYFGLNEYPNPADDDGAWGIYDEPFLQWMTKKLTEFPKPFAATVFTLSSHNPFKIPSQYEGKFPKGPAKIVESIGYTDFALRQFFAEASKQDWYANTLFILTADHTAPDLIRPEYRYELARYRVPIIFYHPRFHWPKVNLNQLVSHVDILPSILDFLGVEMKEENLLGRSVFRPGSRKVVINNDRRYYFVEDGFFLESWRKGSSKLYSLQDLAQSQELSDDSRRARLLRELQAHQQYFSQGMWQNHLLYSRRIQ